MDSVYVGFVFDYYVIVIVKFRYLQMWIGQVEDRKRKEKKFRSFGNFFFLRLVLSNSGFNQFYYDEVGIIRR